MRKIVALFFIAGIFFVGCNTHQTLKEKQAQVATGKIDESLKYTCNEVGWETYLPKDWNLLTNEETEKLNKKVRRCFGKSTGTTMDMSGLKELVNLKKKMFL